MNCILLFVFFVGTYSQAASQFCSTKNRVLFNGCVKNYVNSFIRGFYQGSNDINLPPFDPLFVDSAQLQKESKEEDVSLQMEFTDIVIKGLGDTKVFSVKSDLEELIFEITGRTSFLSMDGHYKSNGNLLTVPLFGEGNFHLNMSDVVSIWNVFFKSAKFNDVTLIMIDEFHINMRPANVSYYLGNLLGGQNDLDGIMNKFFNENSQKIYSDIKENLMSIVGKQLKDVGNSFLSQHTKEELFLD